MASIKVLLRTNKRRKDGSCPIAIRITKDRKARFIFTGQYIHEKDWNDEERKVRKSHPNSARLNNLILGKVAEANNLLLESETSNDNVSAKEIQSKIKKVGKSQSFFDIAKERIAEYRKKGTYSVAQAEQSIVNNLYKFTKGRELYFQEIDQLFLSRLKVFCSSQLGQKTRTITNHLIFIRTIFNIALKQGAVNAKHYPFGGEKEKIRIGSGLKVGLTKEEVERIENLDLKEGSQLWHTKHVWLFAFYFAGVRISDVIKLRWSDFKDGRLLYVMNKNEKPVSLKIPEKAKTIMDAYRKAKSHNGFVFPYMENADLNDKRDVFVKARNASRLLNKYLKRLADMCEIDKNLSNHIARHTFGNIAGDRIHPLMLQKLYRHSDLKTTINYQANFIHKEADEALDSVVDF